MRTWGWVEAGFEFSRIRENLNFRRAAEILIRARGRELGQ